MDGIFGRKRRPVDANVDLCVRMIAKKLNEVHVAIVEASQKISGHPLGSLIAHIKPVNVRGELDFHNQFHGDDLSKTATLTAR
jgi:hypothetical protein